MKYFLYILTCSDGSLYTGITNDIEKRMQKHKEGKGSKYVRAHMPFTLSYVEECENKSSALKREMAIKEMSREQKQALISKHI